jgi:hypothetical protein
MDSKFEIYLLRLFTVVANVHVCQMQKAHGL